MGGKKKTIPAPYRSKDLVEEQRRKEEEEEEDDEDLMDDLDATVKGGMEEDGDEDDGMEDGEEGDDVMDGEEEDDDDIDPEELEKEKALYMQMKRGKYETLDGAACEKKLDSLILRVPGGEEAPWPETLRVITARPLEVKDVHDDLERETVFYQHAILATREARKLFEQYGIKYKRPNDYFAEMVKTDEHMKRVKGKLIQEKERLADMEKRQNARQQRKMSKQIAVLKQQEAAKKKKADIEAVTKWRKQKASGKIDTEFGIELDHEPDSKAQKRKERDEKYKPQPSKKRKMKDERYGRGGKSKLKKINNRDSVDDFGSGKSIGGKRFGVNGAVMGRGRGGGRGGGFRGGRGGRGGGNAGRGGRGGSRPGKSRRQ